MLNEKDYDGRTCLHVAVSMGQADIVKYLVSQGVEINARDRFGGRPLDDAIRQGHPELASLLVENGADSPSKLFELELINACSTGNEENVKMLLNNRIDPNCADYDGEICFLRETYLETIIHLFPPSYSIRENPSSHCRCLEKHYHYAPSSRTWCRPQTQGYLWRHSIVLRKPEKE